ncbi:hypothetical protein N8608_02360 [bacterium]|nr:hypothetical protein [bacterium]
MPVSSTLTNQLATLGIILPAWPEEPEGESATEDWIQRGKAYAEGLRLWRAHLRNAPESTKGVLDQLMRHLQDTSALGVWDQLVYGAIKSEVQGSPDFERWQACTKLIRSSALTPAQLLGIALELAREQRLAAATYGLKRLLKEQPGINALQRLELCSELVSVANTGGLISSAKTNRVSWDHAVDLHEHLAGLLATAFAEEVSGDLSQGAKSIQELILSKLDAINNCLGSKGVHGHAEFIAVCHEKLPALLEGWSGERPWIVEVGCSREIIEGQNSTVQLLASAKELELPLAGIDLDHANIEALERDYREFNATWITGKGEEVLQTWNKPIAAIYLDAYDFWHASHSELRQQSYLENYGTAINDAECHTMHLEAARHCSKLIPVGGLIGLDDTWLENGKWVGKGALALPWLVDQGWELLSSANRGTVLLNTGAK